MACPGPSLYLKGLDAFAGSRWLCAGTEDIVEASTSAVRHIGFRIAGRQTGSSQACLGLLCVLEGVVTWTCVTHALLAAG